MDGSSWDGKGYRITVPYTQSREKEGDEIQFRHYMCDIFNGLVSRGFSIEQVEDRWIGQPDLDAPAGSWEHWLAYIVGFEIVARKSVFNARAEEEL